jgi:SNF2 family DNA or RNA helicase
MTISVELSKTGGLIIKCPFNENELITSMAAKRWDKRAGGWRAPLIRSNAHFLLQLNEKVWVEMTNAARDALEDRLDPIPLDRKPFPPGYVFKDDPAPPMPHQIEACKLAWPRHAFALMMEMGTSKTRIAIDLATARFMAGKIDRVLVICPVSIMSVWREEIEKWSPHPCHHFVEGSIAPKNPQLTMFWKIVGVESLSSSPKARLDSALFLRGGRGMAVCDESSRIKNGEAIRTKAAIELANDAKFRLILNGTPVAKSPLDLWAQYEFLDSRIIDMPWSPFRYSYGIFGGYENKQLVGFQRIDELTAMLRPWTYQVLKKDVLKDLPEKTYQVRTVRPTAQQTELMKHVKSKALELHTPDGRLKMQNVLERTLRLQQITSGFLVLEKMDEAGEVALERAETRIASPKMTEMLSLLEEFDGKAIIWSRFVSDIHEITNALSKEYGPGSAVMFYGDMTPEERQAARIRFQEDPKCRFFVSNPATGGMGLTLIAATLVIYYSCSYAYIDRTQSEDRAHRKGQTLPVTIIDLVVENSVDGLVHQCLRDKKSMAEYVQENLAVVAKVLM